MSDSNINTDIKSSRAHTMPELNRGHMTPVTWRKFFDTTVNNKFNLNKDITDDVAGARRIFLFITTLMLGVFGAYLISPQLHETNTNGFMYSFQLFLFFTLFVWISMGFVTAVMGAWVLWRGDSHSLTSKNLGHYPIISKTAVVMTICNEDVNTVFAGIKATMDSVIKTNNAQTFDFYILSDTPKGESAQKELIKYEEVKKQLGGNINFYYRRRVYRVKKKSGNVEDFCRRWGNNYDYMVVLDADSIMTGDCLEKLARLMDKHPTAGIIQTVPKTCGHDTLHARVEQFSSRMIGKIFTLGMQFWQLGESHYWGHNAIIRVKPFMEHCSLDLIRNDSHLSGHILSHDFLEAALMRRAGYKVWLVQDLDGSYEQQPPNMLAELQRDRRWCQGNLQNIQLLTQPGFHMAHRAMLFTGVMSYLSAPLWLMFFLIGSISWAIHGDSLLNIKEADVGVSALWMMTALMLMAPRIMAVLVAIITKETNQYGGLASLLKSTALETVLSIFKAPVKMVAHSVFVVGAVTGWKLEWKSPPREAVNLSWNEVSSFFWSFSVAALVMLFTQAIVNPSAILWLLPVCLPLLLSIPVIVLTGNIEVGVMSKNLGFLLTPEEIKVPQVVIEAEKNIYSIQHSMPFSFKKQVVRFDEKVIME